MSLTPVVHLELPIHSQFIQDSNFYKILKLFILSRAYFNENFRKNKNISRNSFANTTIFAKICYLCLILVDLVQRRAPRDIWPRIEPVRDRQLRYHVQ
jgi:hypothetical protein